MKPHTVRKFDQQLDAIKQGIVTMGELAQQQLAAALAALGELDTARCEQIISDDRQLDDAMLKIENLVVDLLALRQPMADDLRMVIAALRGSRDLERIGDYAKNIARHTITIARYPRHSAIDRLCNLSDPIHKMLVDAVSAYDTIDDDLANQVRDQDAAIDAEYTALFSALLQEMEQGGITPTLGTHLLFIARCLERIGDHTTNLVEDVMFIAEGALPSDTRTQADQSYYTTGSD